ncbi:MAG: Oxidoreductase family, NAD-binding Rossmann fold [Planctomycetota bacterium]|jgi:hypothetical protein
MSDSFAAPLRIGIVGAARTRQGLGPFLATACERAGAQVVGVSGRDPASGQRAAAALAEQLGHKVVAAADAEALAAAVDAVLVASPAEAHADGLAAALAHSRPCLCEKPLLPFGEAQRALALVEAFVAHGVPLFENCQWPEVRGAHLTLFPDLAGRRVSRIAMGLGPGAVGPRMIEDSLSHVLSVVQAWCPLVAGAAPSHIEQSDGSAQAERNTLRFLLPTAHGSVRVELHLTHSPSQPRPAWIDVDGCRIDRRIGAGYALSFVAAGAEVAVRDPMFVLVERFVAACRSRDLDAHRRRAAEIAQRARLGAAICAALGG